MNISIFAAVGSGNLGDELILKNEIILLKKEFWEDTQFRVFTYDIQDVFYRDPQVSYLEYFPIDFRNIKKLTRNITNFKNFVITLLWSQRVVIWGWWIMYDSELQSVWNPLKQWEFRTKWARFLRKKIYFYAVWIDIKQQENFKLLGDIFKNAWKVTVRDQKSKDQLKSIWIDSHIIDDPVLHDNSIDEKKWNVISVHASRTFRTSDFDSYDFRWKKIWLALRSWYFWTSWNTQIEVLIIEELCKYLESRWAKLIFLPHSFHPTDTLANDYEFMKQFLTLDREICASMWEVYTIYNHHLVHTVISMRLHSIILSYVYGIDQIVLSYSQKTEELLKKLEQ